MSDLQLSLIVIGVTIIGGVLLYNWVQERSFRRRLKQAFGEAPADVLLQPDEAAADDARVEPRLQDPPVAARVVRPAAEARVPAQVATRPPAAPASFDDTLDYVAEIETENPISGAVIEELMSRMAGCGRPARTIGLNPETGQWEQLARGSSGGYRGLRSGLQLVNRSGSVTPAQLATFCDAVSNCAEKVSGFATCPDAQTALKTARELDAFCAGVDVAVGVNVVADEGMVFSGTRIRGLAEAAGFKLEPDGVFHYRNDQRETLFTLDNHEPAPFLPESIKGLSTRGVTLLMDVPRVGNGAEVMDRMLEVAQGLAAALGGQLVDDNRTALSESGLARIKEQVRTIHARMDLHGIAAGSPRARRLFS